MATEQQLTKKVDELSAAATKARIAWKDSIPGPSEPKMTNAEQKEVDELEEAYDTAKAARVAAEKELANFITTAKIAADAGTPVTGTDTEDEEALDASWNAFCRRMGYGGTRPRPADWDVK